MSAIMVENLSKRYRKGPLAVSGVSFRVEAGEVLGLLGPNGAGKSTVIGMLTGQITPTAGRVEIDGYDVTRYPEELRGKIGLVFEHQNIYPRLTARENLQFFASLLRAPSTRVDELLRRFGLWKRADDTVNKYSRGMKQRVMLARAVLHNPEIIILDEPTSGLDPAITQEMHEMVAEWQQAGKAILLATHSMEEAAKLCRNVVIMNHGVIVAQDRPQELMVAHGRGHLHVEYLDGDAACTRELPLDEAADVVERILRENRMISMHTVEASLQEVFVKLTGNSGGR